MVAAFLMVTGVEQAELVTSASVWWGDVSLDGKIHTVRETEEEQGERSWLRRRCHFLR